MVENNRVKVTIAVLLIFSISGHSFEYEFAKSCNSTNNYLQKQIVGFKKANPTFYSYFGGCTSPDVLSKANSSNIKKISGLLDSTSLCLHESMKSNKLKAVVYKNGKRSSARYAYCPGSTPDQRLKAKRQLGNSSGKSYQTPCFTKELHEMVMKTFLTVTDCVGIDKGVYFSMVNHESKFIPNIGNSLKVYGIAQLSSVGAKEVNRVYLGKKRDDFTFLIDQYAKRKGHKISEKDNACARIMGTLKNPFPSRSLTACERSAFPRNPLRSMLYGSLLHSYYQKRAGLLFDELVSAGVKKKVDRLKVVTTIAKYIYNGGEGGVRTLLKNYFITKSSRAEGKKVTVKEGEKTRSLAIVGGYKKYTSTQFKDEFAEYILNTRNFPKHYKASKQKELGNYVKKIDKDRLRIEGKLKEKGLEVRCGI